jgi:hypothetical protein
MPQPLPSPLAWPRQRLKYFKGEATTRQAWPFFALAMVYAAGCALLALRQAFASSYMIADDAREHVFWMFRYIDPGLFPHNPAADYFQSLAPPGYAALYWLLAHAGIDPLLASRLIPSLLSLIATGFFFALASRFFRSPAVAALSAVLFCQCLWLNSDLASATPRAFFYPLFVAFLYFHVCRSPAGVLITVALEALFFPPAALLSVGVLGFDCLQWKGGLKITPASDSRCYLLFGAAFAFTALCLLSYLQQAGTFGPLVTYDEARRMPEFGAEGRVPFFLPSWWGYWVAGNGGVHTFPTRPPWFLLAFLWPLLRRFPNRFPLLNAVPRGAWPIPQVIGASLFLFVSAHLLLFHLYLPNRYTGPVARILLILLAGGVMLALVDAALRWAKDHLARRPRFFGRATFGMAGLLLGVVASYPLLLPVFPTADYINGADPGLYQFFARQPVSIRIASLSDEADNLPILCRRSIIIGAECAVPFHPGYYLPLRESGLQIARAQYSPDPAVLERCLRDQQVDFWLLDRKAFAPKYWHKSRLLRQLRLSAPEEDLGVMKGATPFLQRPPSESIAYEDTHFLVLDARRLLSRIEALAAVTGHGSSILQPIGEKTFLADDAHFD